MKEETMRNAWIWTTMAIAVGAILAAVFAGCSSKAAAAPERTAAEELATAVRTRDRARIDEQEAIENHPTTLARKRAERLVWSLLVAHASKVGSEPNCYGGVMREKDKDACKDKIWGYSEAGAPALVHP